MATPTHHQPTPTSAAAAAAFFKCHSSHCSLSGEACATRWGRANPKAAKALDGEKIGKGSPFKANMYAAGCVGCAAGEARQRLLSAEAPEDVAELTREAISSAPPAVEAEVMPQRSYEEDALVTSCASCGGLVTCMDDCPKGGYGEGDSELDAAGLSGHDLRATILQAFNHNEAGAQLREDMGPGADAQRTEQGASLRQLVQATLRAQLSSEAQADEAHTELQRRASRFRAERDEAQAAGGEDDKLKRELAQVKGRVINLTDDLSASIGDLESLSAELKIVEAARDEAQGRLKITIEGQAAFESERDHLKPKLKEALLRIGALSEKIAMMEAATSEQKMATALETLTRLYTAPLTLPTRGGRSDLEYSSALVANLRRSLVDAQSNEGADVYGDAERADKAEQRAFSLTSALKASEAEVMRLAGENHLLKMRISAK